MQNTADLNCEFVLQIDIRLGNICGNAETDNFQQLSSVQASCELMW